MPITLRPEHLQTIHYYFFAMGMFSLTTAITFFDLSLYSLLFFCFYVTHSAISWYVSWVLHRSMRDIMVINSRRYSVSHIVLALWSVGLGILLWYLFSVQYESLMFSLISVNFFILILAGLWFLMAKFRLLEKLLTWQDRKQLQAAKKLVMEFRKKAKLFLVEDDMLRKYSWGSDGRIDVLFGDVGRLKEADDAKGFALRIRDLEIAVCEKRMKELETRSRALGFPASEADRLLMKNYESLVTTYRKRIVDYEREFARRYGG